MNSETKVKWFFSIPFIVAIFILTFWCAGIPALILLIIRAVKYPEKRRKTILFLLVLYAIFIALFVGGYHGLTKDDRMISEYIDDGKYDEALSYIEDNLSQNDYYYYEKKADVYEAMEDYDSAVQIILSYCESKEPLSLYGSSALTRLDNLYSKCSEENKVKIDSLKLSVDQAKSDDEEKKQQEAEEEKKQQEADKKENESEKETDDGKVENEASVNSNEESSVGDNDLGGINNPISFLTDESSIYELGSEDEGKYYSLVVHYLQAYSYNENIEKKYPYNFTTTQKGIESFYGTKPSNEDVDSYMICIKDEKGIIAEGLKQFGSDDFYMSFIGRFDDFTYKSYGEKTDKLFEFTIESADFWSEYDYLGYMEIENISDFRDFIRNDSNVGTTVKFLGYIGTTYGDGTVEVRPCGKNNSTVYLIGDTGVKLLNGDVVEIIAEYGGNTEGSKFEFYPIDVTIVE